MSKGRLCIKIGMARCAGEWLGHGLFPRHPELRYLGRPYDESQDLVRQLIHSILYTPYRDFDLDRARALADQAVTPHLGGDRMVTIADSRLASLSGVDSGLVAERLFQTFGEARILVVIREQLTFLESFYVHNRSKDREKGQFSMSYEDWIVALLNQLNSFVDVLQYDRLIGRYRDLFEPDNVHVVLLEEIRDDRVDTIRRLCRFLGIDDEEGVRICTAKEGRSGRRETKLEYLVRSSPRLMWWNKWVRSKSPAIYHMARNASRRGGAMRPELPQHLRRRIEDQYRVGNRRLVEEFHIPVDRYGYPLSLGTEGPAPGAVRTLLGNEAPSAPA